MVDENISLKPCNEKIAVFPIAPSSSIAIANAMPGETDQGRKSVSVCGCLRFENYIIEKIWGRVNQIAQIKG
jgi:hypothetical protein